MPELASPDEARIALRTTMRYASKLAPIVIAQHAVRRPGVVLRDTLYQGAVVDERVLTPVFPWVVWPSRLSLLAVRRGSIVWEGGAAQPGDVLLLTPETASIMRFEGTAFVELEWTSPRASEYRGVMTLGRVGVAEIDRIADAIADAAVPPRRALAAAVVLGRSLGAPLEGLDPAAWDEAVTPRDEKIARAVCGMLENMAVAADTMHLGEEAAMSPRQLQRVLTKFGETYGLGVKSWRDLRNRWRLQVAAVLVAHPDVEVGDVAAEVGYASGPALARAFAKAGFPPPLEVRRRVLGGGAVRS